MHVRTFALPHTFSSSSTYTHFVPMTGAHCADGAVPGRLATTSANSTASDSVPVNERPFQEMYHQSVKVNTP